MTKQTLLGKLTSFTMTILKRDNTEAVLKDLIERADSLKVRVFEADIEQAGRYGIHRDLDDNIIDMTIEYRADLVMEEQILVIAHELGHTDQFINECSSDWHEWHAYYRVCGVLNIEEDAWLRSIHLLHKIGFKDWDLFVMFATKAFATYIIHFHQDQYERVEAGKAFHKKITQEIKVTRREMVFA